MTIPGPPPKGRSSTRRCLSNAKSRICTCRIVRSPFSRALFKMLSSKGPEKYSGKRERISISTQIQLGCRHLLFFLFLLIGLSSRFYLLFCESSDHIGSTSFNKCRRLLCHNSPLT